MVLAVEDYYRAVDREDWSYTYDRLASGTRSTFKEAEWELKNQWFADSFPARLAALEVETRMFTPSSLVAEVTVNRTFADGTFAPRDTTFVYENGSWKHLFSQEEISLFLPGVPFEQFVAAQQAAGVAPDAQEEAVKEAIRGHYGAIGSGRVRGGLFLLRPDPQEARGASSLDLLGEGLRDNGLDHQLPGRNVRRRHNRRRDRGRDLPGRHRRPALPGHLDPDQTRRRMEARPANLRRAAVASPPKILCARMRPSPFALESGPMTGGKKNRAAVLTEVSLVLAALFWGGNYAATKYATDFSFLRCCS
jgi:hypothetical protein